MILKDKNLVLTPLDALKNKAGFEYLCDLAAVYRYNSLRDKKQLFNVFNQHKHFIWAGEDSGVAIGVIFLIEDAALGTWFLHAYSNPGKTNSSLSKRSAVLVVDFFFENTEAETLAACPNVRNKKLISLCQTLGFEKKGVMGDFQVMGVTKKLWGDKNAPK